MPRSLFYALTLACAAVTATAAVADRAASVEVKAAIFTDAQVRSALVTFVGWRTSGGVTDVSRGTLADVTSLLIGYDPRIATEAAIVSQLLSHCRRIGAGEALVGERMSVSQRSPNDRKRYKYPAFALQCSKAAD
jgi:hypothetical protein